jgi:methyl-accepting chemotaxis protein
MNRLTSSIQTKIVLAIFLAFLAVLVVSMLMTAHSERKLAEDIGSNQAKDFARAYFDGINTMMLTGTMDQKDTLRNKLLTESGLLDIRIVHAPGHLDGVTPKLAPPQDELDRRALAGSAFSIIGNERTGRTVTYAAPIRATGDHLGTDCLSCHHVPDGTIIGAVRVTYSLADLDSRLQRNLLVNIGVNLILFSLGIGLLLALLRRIVISPLFRMREAMQRIEREADLGMRLEIGNSDEAGSLAQAINGMLDRFRNSLAKLADTGEHLSGAADHVASVSDRTAEAADRQRAEIDVAARIVGDLQSIARAVGESAAETAEASVNADREAVQGTTVTREAIGGILGVVREIDRTAAAIEKLDERSRNVSQVLEVIRGIAEQTNLLALNAAIEAARAGDTGRGFAVVADEVRKLATLSRESTQSIETIVTQFQHEAREAVMLMERARDNAEQHSRQLEQAVSSLDRIVAKVADIRGLNAGMMQAVNRQGELTENVSRRMVNVSEIAGRTTTEAVHAHDVSEKLVALARELNGLVAGFKLG